MSVYQLSAAQPAVTLDSLAGKLKPGDVIQLPRGGSGETALGLDLVKGVQIVPVGVGEPFKLTVKSPNPKLNVFRIGAGDDGVLLSGFTLIGGYIGILIQGGASNLTFKDLHLLDQTGYGRYCTGGGATKPSNNVISENVTIEMNAVGEHCERVYNATNWTWTKPTWIAHQTYGGASLAMKQCDGAKIADPIVKGHPWQLGRNPNDPASYKVRNVLVTNVDFDHDLYMGIGNGCELVSIKGGTIKTNGHGGGAVLNFPGDAHDITIAVNLRGGSRPYKGNVSGVKWPATTYTPHLDGSDAKAVT